MRSASVLPAVLVAGALALLAGCQGGPGGRSLSFAEMQSINPGVSGDWILAEYPFASRTERWPDGRVKALRYAVTDPNSKSESVLLTFDRAGVLATKTYTGPIVRPPSAAGN